MRSKPSTKSRTEGYAKLNSLGHLLLLLLCPGYDPYNFDQELPLKIEFKISRGWKDFMIRHIPPYKRGGPDPKWRNYNE